MKENLPLIRKLVRQRYTYREIGERLGVSKQRIHQIFKNYIVPPYAERTYKQHYTTIDGIQKEYVYDLKGKLLDKIGHICIVCKESNPIEVHHIDGNRSNNSLVNLIPLCKKHHQESEKKLREKGIKQWNYTNRENRQKEVSCQICGKKYKRATSLSKKGKYYLCSTKCKGLWRTLI